MTSDDYADPQSSPPNHITLLQDHKQVLFISATHDSSSLSCPSFCTITRDHMRGFPLELSPHDHEDGSSILHVGSGNFQKMSTSPLPFTNQSSSICGHSSAFYKEEDQIKSNKMSVKWMPSETSLTVQKTTGDSTATGKPTKISPRLHNQQHGSRELNARTSSANTGKITVRVCSDCNTTTTPLWRSGPRGPKSLCNACGIRQRKQRKAEPEASRSAANRLPVAEVSSTKASRLPTKEKKPRINHLAQFKNKSKSAATCRSQRECKLSFKDFSFSWTNYSAFHQDFPQDDVAGAAILLMALSCGFPHL